MRQRVVIIGSGNVAEALARRVAECAECDLTGVYARNEVRGKSLAAVAGTRFFCDGETMPDADFYIISVSDSAIEKISEKYNFGDGVVVHTSGSCSISVLSDSLPRRGVLYPLQTFTAGREVDFKKIPIFIEASDAETYTRVERLAGVLSPVVHGCDSDLRRRLHVAAVFVCNFVNHMYVIGEELMESSGLDFSILKPLIEETTHKMLESGSPRGMQTGPAVREDMAVIDSHLKMLTDKNLNEIYKKLTDSIITKKRQE